MSDRHTGSASAAALRAHGKPAVTGCIDDTTVAFGPGAPGPVRLTTGAEAPGSGACTGFRRRTVRIRRGVRIMSQFPGIGPSDGYPGIAPRNDRASTARAYLGGNTP